MNFSIACIAFTTVAAWGDQGLGKLNVSETNLNQHKNHLTVALSVVQLTWQKRSLDRIYQG